MRIIGVLKHNLYSCVTIGSVYFVDDKGRSTQCFTADSAVRFLLYGEGRDMIVVVTDGLVLSQLKVAHDGTISEFAKVCEGQKGSQDGKVVINCALLASHQCSNCMWADFQLISM